MPDDSANEKECENTAGNSSSDHDNGSNEIASDGDPSQSQDNEAADSPEADGSDPFADVLDENAAFDDFIDDLRDAIAANTLDRKRTRLNSSHYCAPRSQSYA